MNESLNSILFNPVYQLDNRSADSCVNKTAFLGVRKGVKIDAVFTFKNLFQSYDLCFLDTVKMAD